HNGTFVWTATSGFGHYLGESCWRRLTLSSSSTSLFNIRYPDLPAMTVGAPHRDANGWHLELTAHGADETLTIDGKTHLVRTVSVLVRGTRSTQQVAALSAVPALPSPKPLCAVAPPASTTGVGTNGLYTKSKVMACLV